MVFVKGISGNPSGRPRGALNKYTELKQTILDAFGELGGTRWLVKQARKNPAVFIHLLGRLLPRETIQDEEAISPAQFAFIIDDLNAAITEEIDDPGTRARIIERVNSLVPECVAALMSSTMRDLTEEMDGLTAPPADGEAEEVVPVDE
jgi:hypothetical protein